MRNTCQSRTKSLCDARTNRMVHFPLARQNTKN